jgi:RHS repeat-associated protein
VISQYNYAVNAIGQRSGVTTSGSAFPALPSWAWGYDLLGQVITADSSVNTSDRSYQYDTIGNRQKSANSLTLPTANNYAANTLNQYSQITSNSITSNPVYDFDGNMTSGPLPAAPTANSTLVWDAENRLISTTVGTVTTTYQYDAQSRRIAKIAGTTATSAAVIYLYDAWNSIAEYTRSAGPTPTFTLQKTRLWGTDLSGSMQGAGGVGGLLSESYTSNPQSPICYPLYDGNGNVSEYLTATGSVAAHYEYDPFGNTVVNTDTGNQFTYRFSTKPLDLETGLYYYGYRYYDPVTGRWPSRDPIAEKGGKNLYGFVGNMSISKYDRLGMKWVQVDGSFTWTKKLEITNIKIEFGNAGNGGMVFDVAKITWKGRATVTCKCEGAEETKDAGGDITAKGEARSEKLLMFSTSPGPPMGPVTGLGDALASFLEAGLSSSLPPGITDPANNGKDLLNVIQEAAPDEIYWDNDRKNPCQALK